ncbi:transglutaminase family protein [Rheinheimera baltica]|uniref:transglutaminase family protein n=1 Tax=Rheinheimera baltica TaxID=67576 RepID=UPI00273D1426|nr:DUF3488 and transglutaminase-like domain-containing protein [Rheinheimera baltica]MDP5151243.1 DUF3488 and transglutaminase-like domain-containing protein [Rheinheimera baltica]
MLIPARLVTIWAALQLGILLLLQQAFAVWMMALFALMLVYKLITHLSGRPAIGLKLVNLIAAAIAIALMFNLRQSGVLNFMLQILLLAAICRLLALKHSYDARQLVWVHYFLVGSCFVMHQDMLVALAIFFAFTLNLYSHFYLFAPSAVKVQWHQTGRSLLIILPLWLGMFLLFPRVPPFWQIPNAKIASSGLSDTLDPGSIEQLVRDDSLAFRAEFDGAPPSQDQLYWRSYLYEDFDGRRWQVNAVRKNRNRMPNITATGTTDNMQYRIIAEASRQYNLFALALPSKVNNDVYIGSGGLIKSNKPVSQRISYQVTGANTLIAQATDNERDINLDVAEGNAETLNFARQLAKQHSTPAALVQAISAHFNQQDYYYSLTPPMLGSNSIDEFLFDTRTGFCSHYASATALILRAAGVPARVVGGYQGGVWHPQQGYLAVRQREAHAWVEYLYEDQWHLYDPTAAVAPERILDSLESALTLEQQQMLMSGWLELELLQNLRLQLMHLDYYWSVWVLGFNDNNQQAIWRNLRQHITLIAITFTTLLALIFAGFVFLWWRNRPLNSTHEATLLIQRQLGKLMQSKAANQSMSAFMRQLSAQHPTQHDWLILLTLSYEQAVFNNDTHALKSLQKQLKCNSKRLKILRRSIKNT